MTKKRKLLTAALAIVLALALILVVVRFAFPDAWNDGVDYLKSLFLKGSTPEGALSAVFLDVGQGDCIFLALPDGKTMLVDGGDNLKAVEEAIALFFTKYGVEKLDYVVLTHTDADHCGSLDYAIKSVKHVEKVYFPKIDDKNRSLGLSSEYKVKDTAAYLNAVKEAKNAKKESGEECEIDFLTGIIEITGAGYKITMYCRSDEYYKTMRINDAHDANDVSPIIIVECNGRKLVLTGDANKSDISSSSEKNFLDIMASKGVRNLDFDADILKVAHHGGKDSSGDDFLSFVKCEYAVISVGGEPSEEREPYSLYINQSLKNLGSVFMLYPNKKYGHPTAEVASTNGRLYRNGVKELYITWLAGTVECSVNEEGVISFKTERVAVDNNGTIEFKERGEINDGVISLKINLFIKRDDFWLLLELN
ncbi:MAG: MBL fold metallo-hydrolase [Clostridiales bacterium]|nr:MBL fold metallo-hydrolase [Clostridiales bacterium]